MTEQPENRLYYQGEPIENLSKDMLIVIIKMLMAQLQVARQAQQSLNDLHKLREGRR